MATAFQLAEGEKLYRVGVNPDCPVHGVTLAGQNFTRRSEKVTGYGGETLREPMDGSIVVMQPGQVERCMAAATHKVVRSTKGKRARAMIVDKRIKGFRSLREDVEVAGLIYAEEVVPANNPHASIRRQTLAEDERFGDVAVSEEKKARAEHARAAKKGRGAKRDDA